MIAGSKHTGFASSDAVVPIKAVGVEKIYRRGDQEVRALDGVTLDIKAGEFVAVMGASGSGKSTLMNLLGGLDVPSSGRLELLGRNLAELAADELAQLRNVSIGFVFQQFNLLARTNALRQVMLPLSYSRPSLKPAAAEARARECLEAVGLSARLSHLPSQLSGGQQQRVAIARALVNSPRIILADEPTGALDSQTSREIMALLCDLNATGITVVVVTHDASVAAYAKRCITFRDGRIVTDTRQAKSVEEHAA